MHPDHTAFAHRLRYRPEIDGLRAFAVIPVILFHAGFKTFSGGFVGVDIFFVISGYLITSIIISEKLAGTFSLLTFYERRARRILPALYLVTLCCVPFALMWMAPEQLRSFGQSVIAVALFVSNVLFWLQSGYFTAAADEKPLLHTWSLGIEEQYYIVFPLLVMALWRFGLRKVALGIIVLMIPSLILARIGSYRWSEAAFYLIFFRAWELAIGALVALVMVNPVTLARWMRELLGGLGSALIVYAVFSYSGKTPYPGTYALAPTLGAALIILSAGPQTIVGRMLSIAPLVGIGLLSYSLYLWHQPLLAFYRVVYSEEPSAAVAIVLMIVCFALAYLTWRYVERPGRYKMSACKLAASAAFASVLVVGTGALVASGHVGRTFTPVQMAQMAPVNGNKLIASEPCEPVADSAYGFQTCSRHPDLKRKAMLYGDSHAGAIYQGLSDALAERGIDLIHLRQVDKPRFECEPMLGSFRTGKAVSGMREWCAERTLDMARIANRLGAENLFVALRYTFRLYPVTGIINTLDYDNGEGGVGDESYREYFVFGPGDALSLAPADKRAATIAAFRSLINEFQGKLTFIGPVPEAGWRIENRNRSQIMLFGQAEPVISTDYKRFKKRNAFANEILSTLGKEAGAMVIQPSHVFCNSVVPNRCVAQTGGVPLYSDDDHLSLEGAKLLSRHIVEQLQQKNALQ